jgi:hypothetical protein
MSELDTALAELSRVPPKEFTRTRAAWVARLRQAGDVKAAARVKARRVPPIPVWVVNRLAQDAGQDLDALISASKSLRAAQLGRRPRGEAVGEATAERRTAIERLLKRARNVLREARTAPNHQMLLRVQTLLTAAAADPETQRTLRKGEIERELAAPGFDVFSGVAPAPTDRGTSTGQGAPTGRAVKQARAAKAAPEASRTKTREPSAKAGAADARRREREEQRRQKDEQRQERLTAARAALEATEAAVAAANRELDEAQQRLDALLDEVDQARRLVGNRREQARKAQRAASEARRALRAAGRGAATRSLG